MPLACAPRTVLGLQPAPLGVHVNQLPLQLLHFGLGLVQLVLVGAAQLLSIGLQAPSTAWLSSALATDHRPPTLGSPALLSVSDGHTRQRAGACQSSLLS